MLTKSASSSNPVKVCLRITWNIHVHNKIHVLGINSTRCLKDKKTKKHSEGDLTWRTYELLSNFCVNYHKRNKLCSWWGASYASSCVSLACFRHSNLVRGWRRDVRRRNKNRPVALFFLIFSRCQTSYFTLLPKRLGFPQQVWW